MDIIFIWFCTICKKEFNSKELIKEHYTKNHLTCDICQKQFLIRKRLREHILMVHKRPLFCNWCGLNFGKKNRLLSHQKKCKLRE